MDRVPKNRYLVFTLLAVVGCAVDLLTKSWIFGRLGFPTVEPIWIWPDILSLETSLNEGALFGQGQGYGALFAALSIAAAAGILYWLFYLGAARDWLLAVALGCITAGIFGNLYDRIGLPGLTWPFPVQRPIPHEKGDPVFAVRDWIHFQYKGFDWPIFNIADSLLVCGAGLLICHSFRHEPKPAAPAEEKK